MTLHDFPHAKLYPSIVNFASAIQNDLCSAPVGDPENGRITHFQLPLRLAPDQRTKCIFELACVLDHAC